MGTSQSIPNDYRKEVNGSIKISLIKRYFASNEVIQGMLYIRLDEPFQGYFLSVSLQGFEEVNYTYQYSSDNDNSDNASSESRTMFVRKTSCFLNYSMPIYDFSQGTGNQFLAMQPCQIQIPFQLAISEVLPSSLQYIRDQDTKCSLKYVLNAQILSSLPNVKPVRGSQEIFIDQRINFQNLPKLTKSIQSPVVFYCCNSGKIEYNIQLESRHFTPGEIINIKVNADLSNYKNKVNSFTVKLIGKLKMSAQGHRDFMINQFEKEASFEVNSKQVSQEAQLQIPEDVLLTTQGQQIKMNYYLQIIPKIDSFCCVTDQSPHEIYIYLIPKHYQFQSIQQVMQQLLNLPPPQNWNPIQLQQVQFNQIQQNQMEKLYYQNLAYEQQLIGKSNSIQLSNIVLDFQQQNINQQQIISKQPFQNQQNYIQAYQASGQQQNMYPSQSQNNQLQIQGHEALLGQPVMKDQNKAYL
ncbi:hypothetical protein ABPG74_011230 [Tetrahymena malaccensis]